MKENQTFFLQKRKLCNISQLNQQIWKQTGKIHKNTTKSTTTKMSKVLFFSTNIHTVQYHTSTTGLNILFVCVTGLDSLEYST